MKNALRRTDNEGDVRWDLGWVVMWTINVVVLAALAFGGVAPTVFATALVVLFLVPELLAIGRHSDEYPPLTYVVARYVPRWIPHAVTFAIGAWLAAVWWQSASHPLVAVCIVAAFVGWLTNHWIVTYESAEAP